MGNNEFQELCKEQVAAYHNERFETKISKGNAYVVWLCKVLQNNKALLSTTLSDGMYYEVTHNEDKKELYFDAYKKQENIKIDL